MHSANIPQRWSASHDPQWEARLAAWDAFRLLWQYESSPPARDAGWKRAVDVIIAAGGLLVCAPLLLLVALAIKLESRGPVLYSQERVGYGGRIFRIHKFRSMVVDAEAGGPCWAHAGLDPRVTRVGAWLRRTHLDELPQLWNVLQGDMSLVGPRPERPCFVETLQRGIPGYHERHRAKPGITGLAQVHYRYDTSLADVRRKLRFDRLYLMRMSPALDLRILWQTLSVVVGGKGQ